MEKIDLPDGGWAQLRDPDEVTERQRRPLVRLRRRTLAKMAPAAAGLGDDATAGDVVARTMPLLDGADLDAMDDIDDLLIVTLVESWSFEQDVSVDGAQDLPGKTRRRLLEACAPLVDRLFGETTDEDVLDPASPTVPANGSDRP